MNALVIIPAYTHVDDRLLRVLLESRLPWVPRYRQSDLPRCRSQLLSHAILTSAERVLLIDADIVPKLDQLIELAESPNVTPEQALSGTYRLRDGRVSGAPGEPVGLGFCAVHRQSLQRAAESLPVILSDREPWYPFCLPLVIECPGEPARYLADDGSLWWRLKQSGTQLAVQRELHVGHAVLQETR
jgi:hypothetical protein